MRILYLILLLTAITLASCNNQNYTSNQQAVKHPVSNDDTVIKDILQKNNNANSLKHQEIVIMKEDTIKRNKNVNQLCDCSAILIPDQVRVPIYNKPNNGKIINYIKNDTIKQDYFILDIAQIIDSFAFVQTYAVIYDTVPKIGWIKTKFLGIYPGRYDTLNLYIKPDKRSGVKTRIIEPGPSPMIIIKCQNKWLYVQYLDDDKKIKKGWLAPEDQCANPYTSCN